MPTIEEIAANKERLYESSSLRDDVNDAEATVLLQWGEAQVERLVNDFPDDFEQKCRFLRQLIKNINRFVGQRQFNEFEGQQQYMSKVSMYLPQLGWESVTEEQLFAALPEDKADMSGNLLAILNILSPSANADPTDTMPDPDSGFMSEVSETQDQTLENMNEDSITQDGFDHSTEIEDRYGEEE